MTQVAANEIVTGKFENCWRCGGSGRIQAFSHIAGGCCFGCGGSGRQEAGKVDHHKNLRVSTFVKDGIVWQFEAIHEGEHAHTVARKGQEAHSVLFQCFEVGANRRKGTTLLRARVKPEIGFKVFRDAAAGMSHTEMDNDYLGGFKDGYGRPIGKWDTNTSACSRNKRGIDLLLM